MMRRTQCGPITYLPMKTKIALGIAALVAGAAGVTALNAARSQPSLASDT